MIDGDILRVVIGYWYISYKWILVTRKALSNVDDLQHGKFIKHVRLYQQQDRLCPFVVVDIQYNSCATCDVRVMASKTIGNMTVCSRACWEMIKLPHYWSFVRGDPAVIDGNIGSDHCLLSDNTKPLPEPMLTNHQFHVMECFKRYYNMTVWIVAGIYISFTIAAGFIVLHMPGVKKSRV